MDRKEQNHFQSDCGLKQDNMAVLWASGAPFSRDGFKKRSLRRYASKELYLMGTLGFTMLVLVYWYMIPAVLKPNWATSRPPSPRGGGQDWSDSTVRIEHVPPAQWTSDDVGAWLKSIELPQLRQTFKKNVSIIPHMYGFIVPAMIA